MTQSPLMSSSVKESTNRTVGSSSSSSADDMPGMRENSWMFMGLGSCFKNGTPIATWLRQLNTGA